MAFLDENPPARRQFYCPRRDGTQPSGVVVVHDAENTPDVVAPDSGAEAVARFIATRDSPGSYHDLADSDSIVHLVRYECEAFHDATGTNRHSYGVSGAYSVARWATLPQAWRDGCVRNMATAAARYAGWLKDRRGIVIPAKRISETAARNRVPGFISHAELDPARRRDPGPDFPWDQFLAIFAERTSPAPAPEPEPPVEEESEMLIVDPPGGSAFLLHAGKLVGLKSLTDLAALRDDADVKVWRVSDKQWATLNNAYPVVHT